MGTPGNSEGATGSEEPLTKWKKLVSHPGWWLTATLVLLIVAVGSALTAPEVLPLWAFPLLIGVVVLMAGIIFVFPRSVLNASGVGDEVDKVNAVRTTLLQAVGGLAAVFLGIFAYSQLLETGKQVEIAGRSQTDQVLTSAIGDLGSEQSIVRTGGAYVLKSLAEKHPDYREMSYTLLVNMIRDRSHLATPEQVPLEAALLNSDPDVGIAQLDDPVVGQNSLRRRAADLYAALRVLQSRELLPGGVLFALGLNDTDLRGAVIADADFRSADLRGARLDWADARSNAADEKGADFRCAYLQGTVLFGAHLEDSDFRGAQFDSATVFTPKKLEDSVGFPFLGRAVFDNSTTFTEGGRQLSSEEMVERLKALGMRHQAGKGSCS